MEPSSEWRWFMAAAGLIALSYGYYEHWREKKRGEALVMWLLAAALFFWSGAGLGFPMLAGLLVGWILLLLVFNVARPRLPRLTLARTARGLTVEWLSPEHPGKRRLKRETLRVVRDIYEWLKTAPPAFSMKRQHQEWAEMEAASTENEKNLIWRRHREQEHEEQEAAKLEIAQRFGGKVAHLLNEYQRRGKLSEAERDLYLWKLNSTHWATELARDLEALARDL